MSHGDRRDLSRRVFMAAWGMTTMVLVFTVILLAVVLAKRPDKPQPASTPVPAPAPPQPASTIERSDAAPTMQIPLYFADASGRGLIAEEAAIESTDSTVENCRHAIDALAKGPRGQGLAPILPPNIKVRGMYLLEDGNLVIDFAIELELESRKVKSAAYEAFLAYGVVNTLTQAKIKGAKEPAVAKVTFLIEGQPPRDSFPNHLDLSQPVTPDPGWVFKTGS